MTGQACEEYPLAAEEHLTEEQVDEILARDPRSGARTWCCSRTTSTGGA